MYTLRIDLRSSLNEELFYENFKLFLQNRSKNFFYWDQTYFEFERIKVSSFSCNYVFKYKVTALSAIDYFNYNWYNNVVISKDFD